MATCIATEKWGHVNFKAHLEPLNNGADNIRSKTTDMVLAIIAKGNKIEGIKARW